MKRERPTDEKDEEEEEEKKAARRVVKGDMALADIPLIPYELIMETLSKLDVVRVGQLMTTLPPGQVALFRNQIYHNLALRDFRSPLTGEVYSVVRVFEFLEKHRSRLGNVSWRDYESRDWPRINVELEYAARYAPEDELPEWYWMQAYSLCSVAVKKNAVLHEAPGDTLLLGHDMDDPTYMAKVQYLLPPNEENEEADFRRKVRMGGWPNNWCAQPASVPRGKKDDVPLAVSRRLETFVLFSYIQDDVEQTEARWASYLQRYGTSLLVLHPSLLTAPRVDLGGGVVLLLNAIDMTPAPVDVVLRGFPKRRYFDRATLVATPLYTEAQVRQTIAWLVDFITTRDTPPPPPPETPATSISAYLRLLEAGFSDEIRRFLDPALRHTDRDAALLNRPRSPSEMRSWSFWARLANAFVDELGWEYIDLLAALLPMGDRYGARCTVPARYSLPADGSGGDDIPLFEGFAAHNIIFVSESEHRNAREQPMYAVDLHMRRYDMETMNRCLLHRERGPTTLPITDNGSLDFWLQSQVMRPNLTEDLERDYAEPNNPERRYPAGHDFPLLGAEFPWAALEAVLALPLDEFVAAKNQSGQRAYELLSRWAESMRWWKRPEQKPTVYRTPLPVASV